MKSRLSTVSSRFGRIAAATCFSLGLSAVVAAAQNGIPGYVVLPLALMDRANQATVSAEVNGRRTRFILDTGAPRTHLDTSFFRGSLPKGGNAKPSDLPPELRGKLNANGQKAEFGIVDSLKLGGLDLGKRPVVVTDLSGTLGAYNHYHAGLAVSGLMGVELLQEYGAIIDWARRGIYLNVDKSKRLKLGPALVAAGWTAVPMAPTNGRHYSVQATVEGKKVRLLVDTGAEFTTFASGVMKLGNMIYNHSESAATGSRIQSTAMSMSMINSSAIAYMAKVEHWELGEFEISSSVVSVSPISRSELNESSAGEGPVLGLLGAEVMARHHAIIDVAGSTLYLKR